LMLFALAFDWIYVGCFCLYRSFAFMIWFFFLLCIHSITSTFSKPIYLGLILQCDVRAGSGFGLGAVKHMWYNFFKGQRAFVKLNLDR